jgi:hypothetical protein
MKATENRNSQPYVCSSSSSIAKGEEEEKLPVCLSAAAATNV